MEEVEKEWEQLRPSLVTDYERKKKYAKRAWKQPSESYRRKEKQFQNDCLLKQRSVKIHSNPIYKMTK